MPVDHQNSNLKNKSFCNEENLKKYLDNKAHFTLEEQSSLKYYIDNNLDCWRIWNKVRWDAAMNSSGVEDLKGYLGEDFIPYYDSSWGLAHEWDLKKRFTRNSIEEFYKNTKNYIYNSIIFFYSNDRVSLKDYWLELKQKYNINSVIDYGCGVGNDGLQMLEEDIKVYFCDFNSPTQKFLKWRLEKRKIQNLQYEVLDVAELQLEKKEADMFWAIDVIEHMVNPLSIFELIHPNTKLVVFFTDCDDKAGGRHPFHLNININEIEKGLKSRNYQKIEHPLLQVWHKVGS